MRRVLICILSLTLLLGQGSRAMMMLPPGGADPGEPTEPALITGLQTAFRSAETYYPLAVLAPNGDPETLELPPQVICATEGGSGTYWCPVIWERSAVTGTDKPGRITVPGRLVPEAGYALAEGSSGQIEWPAVVAGERADGAETLVNATVSLLDVELMPLGGDPAEALSAVEALCVTAQPAEYFTCPIDWDLRAIDPACPGFYTISGTPELPAGFALPADFTPFARTVCVIPDDRVTLAAAVFNPVTGRIDCRWIFALDPDTPVRLEYAVGADAWQEDDQDLLFYNWILGSYLRVSLDKLALQTDYYFRMVYGVEGAEQATDVLHVRLENWDFLGPADAAPPFGIGGDRDGGDWDGDQQPDFEQPAPRPDLPEPDDRPVPAELVTATSTVMSGLRVQQLAAAASSVLLEKQGAAVELPSDFLLELGLKNEELLELTLTHPAADTFSLRVVAAGTEITELPETTVRLPWEETEAELECVDLSGAAVSPAQYEPAHSTVKCAIRATGAYQLREAASPALPPDAGAPALSETVLWPTKLPSVADAIVGVVSRPQKPSDPAPDVPAAPDPATPDPAVPAASDPEALTPESPAPEHDASGIPEADGPAAAVPAPEAPSGEAPADESPAAASSARTPLIPAACGGLLAAAGVLWALKKRHG